MAAGRLRALDAFRGVAALSVLLYHVTLRYPAFMLGLPTPATPLLPGLSRIEAGVVPVLWFFLISGFVITWTIDRCRTPMDFVVSRVSRIYPAYWASVVLAVAVAAAWPLPGVWHSPGQVLVNLTMLQSVLLIPDVAGVYWSLGVEILFYAYALALFACGLWRLVHVAALGWAGLALAAALLERAGVPVPWRVGQLLLLHHAPLLVAGMALYHWWRGRHPFWSLLTLGVCAAGIGATQGPVSAALCFAAMALIAGIAAGRLEWLAVPPLVWLGSVSYSLYLVHEYPSYIVMRWTEQAGLRRAAGIGAAIVVSLGLAAAVTYAVERPAMRLIRAAWRIRPSPGPVPAGGPPARPAAPGSPG